MPKWKLKVKGTGTPPTVPDGGGDNFNSADAQYGGGANGRMSAYPHSGTVPGQPANPSTAGPKVKSRAHFPRPRSSSNTGRTVKTTPRYPTGGR